MKKMWARRSKTIPLNPLIKEMRNRRISLNIPQMYLAEKVGIGISTVISIEINRTTAVNLFYFECILQVLGGRLKIEWDKLDGKQIQESCEQTELQARI